MSTTFGFLAWPIDASWLQPFAVVWLKGIVVLLIAAVAARLLRRGSASSRHLVWNLAMCGLLVLPVLEVILPGWRVPIAMFTAHAVSPDPVQSDDGLEQLGIPAGAPRASAGSMAVQSKDSSRVANSGTEKTVIDEFLLMPFKNPVVSERAPAPGDSDPSLGISFNWSAAAIFIWLAGALFVLARLARATSRVRSIVRKAEPVENPAQITLVRELGNRLGVERARLLETPEISMPVTWGIIRPVILLPTEAASWSEECSRIVLLHELSHIKRGDCLVQALAQVACAVHWLNPFVWLAAGRLRVEREIACDDQVLESGTRATDYASHLVEIAAAFEPARLVPTLTVGMACRQLESRVRSILDPSVARRSLNRIRVRSMALVSICLVGLLSIVRPMPTARASVNERATSSAKVVLTGANLIESQVETSSTEPVEPTVPVDSIRELLRRAPTPESTQEQSGSPTAATRSAQSESAAEARGHGWSQAFGWVATAGSGRGEGAGNAEGIGEGSAGRASTGYGQSGNTKGDAQDKPAQSGNLNPDEIVRLKVFDITPEYLESVKRMGFESASVRQLIRLKTSGVDEEFVRQARRWGLDNVTIDQLVRLKMAAITSDYIESLKSAGLEKLSVNRLVTLKLQGITPQYIDEMRKALDEKIDPDELASLKIIGVTPEFVRQAQSWGFGKLTVEHLRRLRLFNVSPAYATEMRSLGFDNIPLGRLIEMKQRGINADFVKEMRGLGFDNLSAEDLLKLKTFGVTSDYVKKMRAAGFKNVSLKRLIELKTSGIDQILLKNSR